MTTWSAGIPVRFAVKMADEEINNAVSIKTPQFSETSAGTWFRVMEAQFAIKNITVSQTKFFHVLAGLPTDISDNVPEEILESQDYDQFKEAVLSFYERTKPELFEKLISSTTMTGRPSTYLRQLQQIGSKTKVGDDLVRHKFIQSLPGTIAPALATQKTLTLTQLGSMADELMPLHNQINHVYNSGHKQSSKQTTTRNEKPFPNSKVNCDINNIPIGLRPYHPNQKPKFCRAHLYYEAKARTCKPWCRYPDKSGCNIQSSSRPSSPHRNASQEN